MFYYSLPIPPHWGIGLFFNLGTRQECVFSGWLQIFCCPRSLSGFHGLWIHGELAPVLAFRVDILTTEHLNTSLVCLKFGTSPTKVFFKFQGVLRVYFYYFC